MKVQTTKVTQAANEVLGNKDKVLHYLIIGEGDDRTVINVGEKTYNSVKTLVDKEKPNEPIKNEKSSK